MKLIKIFLPLFPVLIFSACSSPLINNSLWRDKPAVVDGKANEWSIPLDYYDPKTKLNFSISNDLKNLYLCIRATEDETQKGIMNSGLQIWLDTAGGKKTELEVEYPVMGKQMKLSGFRGLALGERLANASNIYGINATIGYDSNHIMIYEVCIPLKSFYKPILSASDSSKVLGVTFKFTVSPHPSHINKSGNSGSGGWHGGGGGMGGMHGGGMHGGGGNRGSEDESPSSPQNLSAYAKFRLAAKHE